MDLSQILGNGVNIQKMLQKIMNEETVESQINLYDCFQLHFIEEKSQISSFLAKRNKIYKDHVLVFAGSQIPLIENETQEGTKKMKEQLNVVEIGISSIIGRTENENPSEITKLSPKTNMYNIEYLHQFLDEKENLKGYDSVKLDILVNRFTIEWTLVGFCQGKKEGADDLRTIMQAFRNLNQDEDLLTLQGLFSSFKETNIHSKDVGINKLIEFFGWNSSQFFEISCMPKWDFSRGSISQNLMAAPKFKFQETTSSLFGNSEKPILKSEEKPKPEKFCLFKVNRLPQNEKMIRRVESIMKLYIETVSNIEISDENWKMILVFDQQGKICGFMSYYEFGTNFESFRVRISQVFVFPDSRRKGIASKMLIGLFSLYGGKSPENTYIVKSFQELIDNDCAILPLKPINIFVRGIGVESPSPTFTVLYIRFLIKNLPEELLDLCMQEITKFYIEEGKLTLHQ